MSQPADVAARRQFCAGSMRMDHCATNCEPDHGGHRPEWLPV